MILAGGEGTRLRPLTDEVNKHLLPVGDHPMIVHPLKKLVSAGMREILVVSSRAGVAQLASALGSGAAFRCELGYRVQERPAGIADALGVAAGFAHGDGVIVLLGDNLFDDDLAAHLASWDGHGAMVFLARVPDPERFGVAVLDGERVVDLVEKADPAPSDWAVAGIYVYDGRFPELLSTLAPSGRGELEITDLNRAYLARGELQARRLEGRWMDAGTLESYREAQRAFGAR